LIDEGIKDWSSEEKWVFSVATISLIFSFIACVCHLFIHDKFCGKPTEHLLVVVVLAFWCAGLPTLMDRKHDIAVPNFNANLFFSGWGALIVSLLLATRHFELYFKREDDKHLYHWVGFSTSGLVVMCDTARLWKTDCEDAEDSGFCDRTIFGLVLGVISFLVGISIAWVQIRLVLAQIISMAFLVAWCFGVAYLTFDQGPGTDVGTIYFASWLSLLFTVFIAAPAILEKVHSFLGPETTEASPVTTEAAPMKEEVPDTKAGGEEAEEEEIAETA